MCFGIGMSPAVSNEEEEEEEVQIMCDWIKLYRRIIHAQLTWVVGV